MSPGSTKLLRPWSIGSIVVLLVLLVISESGARGSRYTYAGLVSSGTVGGVAATVSVDGVDVRAGHVAAWVGVGGPGLGPHGIDEWIQVGVDTIAGTNGTKVYYEVKRGVTYGYGELPRSVAVGDRYRLEVRESTTRRGWWQARVDGAPLGPPVFLPESHGAWPAQVVAENWILAGSECNSFEFEFSRLTTRPTAATTPKPLRAAITFAPGGIHISRKGHSYRTWHRC
jgi:hypothetical protein